MKKKTIKENRIIRFHKAQENNNQVSDKYVDDEKLVEEESEQINTNEIGEGKSKKVNTDEEDEEEQNRRKIYKAYEELKDTVKDVILDRRTSNMIGVFGINADNVVNMFCRKSDSLTEKNYLGKICYSEAMDIYNFIASLLLEYVQKQLPQRWYYGNNAELVEQIENVYVNPNEDLSNEYSTLRGLSKISKKYQRERNILGIISNLKRIDTGINKYFLIVELEDLNYDVLNKLSKLDNSNLVIIVHALYRTDSIDEDILFKFFTYKNCIKAEGIIRRKKAQKKPKNLWCC